MPSLRLAGAMQDVSANRLVRIALLEQSHPAQAWDGTTSAVTTGR
jgi:hypothetical protein